MRQGRMEVKTGWSSADVFTFVEERYIEDQAGVQENFDSDHAL